MIPSSLESSIVRLAEAAREASFRALYLLGSAARDELSYLCHPDGTVELFSDLEFLAVTTFRFSGKHRRTVRAAIAEEERRIANPNPLFHIDVAFRERRRLAKLPRSIFTFELKRNARLLYGEDVLPEVPTVTADNLDYANTREILYKRLWAIMLHTPRRFLLGRPSERERRVMGYVLCRNVLDIPTVLLPHEGVLLPTYRQRVEHILREWDRLRMAVAFPDGFPAFLSDCLERRRTLEFDDIVLPSLYAQVVAALESAITFLLAEGAGGVPRGLALAELPRYSHRFFNERPISRGEAYGWSRLVVALARRHGPNTALRWARLARKGELTLGLLAMHRATLAHLGGSPAEAKAELERSAMHLYRLWPASAVPIDGDFLEQWFILRELWGDFWRAFIRLDDPSYVERFRNAMEWEDES